MQKDKDNKEAQKEVTFFDALNAQRTLDRIQTGQSASDYASDGIEEDDSINESYLRFWSGDD